MNAPGARTLSELAAVLGGGVPADAMNRRVTGVTADSRRVVPGSVFVALKGLHVDGGKFEDDAVRRGAAAVVRERGTAGASGLGAAGVSTIEVDDAREALADLARVFHGDPARGMTLVGITGTNGKTTTSCLLRSIFSAAGHSTGLIGTIRYEFAGRVLPAPYTTPEAPELYWLLRQMADAGVTHAVMEVSSHALAWRRVRGLEFAAGVFTNLTQDHLDFHGSMEEYFRAKRLLFEGLPASAAAVVNADDPRAGDLLAATRARRVTYGASSPADVRAREISVTPRGIKVTADTPWGPVDLASPLLGRYNASNILAAVAAAGALGVPVQAIRRGVEGMAGVAGRFEKVEAGQPFTVIVDYAHTDDALSRLLAAAREITTGRLAVLFGCGGDRDRGKRPKMGLAAARAADFVVLTSDNPRTEDPVRILSEVEAGVREAGRTAGRDYLVVPDRREAIRRAIEGARAGDTVVLAGKGHEDYQIVGDERRAFSDREEALAALAKSPTAAAGDATRGERVWHP